MVQRFSQALVHTGEHFDIDSQIPTQSVGRLEQIETLQDRNLSPQATQTFAFPAELAFQIPPTGVDDLKGAKKLHLRPRKKLAALLTTVFRPVTMSLF